MYPYVICSSLFESYQNSKLFDTSSLHLEPMRIYLDDATIRSRMVLSVILFSNRPQFWNTCC